MKKLILILTIISSHVLTASADAPAGYYSSLKGKSEASLKTALYEIINPHTKVSSYNALPSYFEQTDLYPNSTRWWDMYSDIPLYLPWSGQLLNREHCLPKSWWGGSTGTPAYVDLFHLYPSEAAANQKKSNYPLGTVTGTPYYDNGFIKVGPGVNSGGAKYVFEPNLEYKGDFARTYFYMVTCYQDMEWKTTWQVRNGTYPSLQQWAIDLLLQWHRGDPVSDKETNRNEAVFKIQGNRNPFIDDPDLVEYIWGNKKGQAYNPTSTPVDPGTEGNLITPTNGSYLDFNQVAVGHSVTAQLILKGENLSGNFNIRITGVNPSLFKASATQVPAAGANTTSGTSVTITYSPTSIGSHSARLSISYGGMPEGTSRMVELRGECLAAPTLTAPTAIDPINITNDSYTARWEIPAGETVDYCVVTVKRYKDSVVTTSEHLAETDTLDIDGLSLGDYDTYAVQSVRLEVRSPISNYVTVRSTSAIEEIIADDPFIVESHPGLLRFRCSRPQTNVTVYDITGRTVSIIDEVTDMMEITLPSGVYLIVSDRHRKPIKVIAG